MNPDVHGVKRALLHLLEKEPLNTNAIFHLWRKPDQPRRQSKSNLNALLHQLKDMGYAEIEGGLWDSTELGRQALANARARKEGEAG